MTQIVKLSATWAVIALLLFKYVYLQLGLMNDHIFVLLSLLLLLSFAFFLAGAETALTTVNSAELALWGLENAKAREALCVELSKLKKVRRTLQTPLAKSHFYLTNSCRTDFWVQDNKVNVQDRLSMVIVCNNIININMVILLAICLIQSSSFLNGVSMPGYLPVFGTNATLDRYLPLAGDAGFSSVGVTLILLFVAELVPKKIANQYPMRFLRVCTFWLVPLGWLKVPGILAEGLAWPINAVCKKLGWPITD